MKVSRRIVIKVCSVVAVGLIAYAALGPANWQLRPMLGWKTEHFLGFLIVTFIACVAWPRPLIVGLALMATAGLLEALQGFLRIGYGIDPDKIISPGSNGPSFSRRVIYPEKLLGDRDERDAVRVEQFHE